MKKPVARLLLGVLFVGALTFSLHSLRTNVSIAPDFPRIANVSKIQTVVVDIPAGATGSEVGQILLDKGVVKSALAYFRAAVANPKSTQVAPGAHQLTKGISAVQALEQLLDPDRIPNLIRIVEGGWKSEVITALNKYGFAQGAIDQAFKDVELPKGFKDAEGLLFPAQYSFPTGTNASQAVQAMVDRFMSSTSGRELLSSSGKYSPSQLLIIASIVQAEGDTKDFARVARVILNRLEISMPLQLDSTVHYIKKVRGQIFLSTNSTFINSPFNTYRRYGLPPSPIGNPGNAAIEATLNPADGDWLYFITVSPGDTRFTRSSDQFLEWKALYQTNRKAGAFK